MTPTATDTVGEIAVQIPGAARELEQLGIDYCCGGNQTLTEACATANISLDEAMTRLQQGLASEGGSEGKDWRTSLLVDLIDHINRNHHVFVREACLRINALAAKVAGVHAQNHPEVAQVQRIFASLAEELRVHLMKEEQVLFPYIARLEESSMAGDPAPPSCFGTVTNPVRMMMQEHDGAGEALRKLRAVTKDYAVPADACTSYQMLYQALKEFEGDLHQHIHLENNILFPRAVAMEERN
jgi:regulator of cell morphogenesis and NO signaling